MRIVLTILVFLLGLMLETQAQIQYGYLDFSNNTVPLRTAADSSQISLPVWDDFSTSQLYPDTSIWMDSYNVQVQSGIGILPPSVNVATFDGADQFGNPYSVLATAAGIGDSLVSKFIDMTGADQSTTFLSFYYQKEGRGELPDDEDYLRLLIKNDTNTWVEAWRISGNDLDVQDEFFFQLIPIDLPGYFHEYFQFKFESFGRLAGPFDNWHLDYIYLNEGRRGERLDLSEHTILNPPTPFFKNYTSVPFEQFIYDPDLYLGFSSVDLYNIENIPTNIGTTFELRHQGGELIEKIDSVVELDTNIEPFEIKTFNSSVPGKELFDGLGDSLYLTSFYFINTFDTVDIVNLRANDTVSMNFSIHEELAYDDGSGEFTAGLNGIGTELAYQFYTPTEDYITGLKIYFPNVNTGSIGSAFIIKIWDQLIDEGQSEIYSLSATRQNGGLNEFTFYPFNRGVAVSDTFYVGYEQRGEGLFVIGYDKNTSSADKVYFRSGTFWEQNTDLTGSLMIRPVFGAFNPDLVTGMGDILDEEVIVFPNPSNGLFMIRGPIEQVQVLDFYGRELHLKHIYHQNEINLNGYPPGIYFLKYLHKGQVETKKLMLR